ncbi:hypothetical protein AXF42_Ash004294 [Apostasia shenzhenica]|uniref:HTH OST-type domain-containing protein n=1 Tax=Apostasia shenzhenica TaxID=1088818 RepID=A0A2I0A2L2_9ASPA|nr:hypothetical protein AXF42_Ash004294 [Apostasia shenzhenica]
MTMCSRTSSPKIPIPESASPREATSVTSNMESYQTPVPQSDNLLHGPVSILWDIENCPVPSDVRPEDVAGNIRMALRVHPLIKGAVTLFSAYGDFNAFPRRLREGCQRTGVKLVDVPNGRKDAADKAILVDMFLFALDNRPPSSIVLISGDVDFAPALHILGQRGYTVILVIPSGVGVSYALSNAGRFVWDWPSIARGEGFVPPRNHNFCEYSEALYEDEAIVYKGNECNYYSIASISRESPGAFLCSKFQSLPSGIGESPSGDQSCARECWVQPGDIQGLKGQLVRLVEMSGGSLPLVRVPSEYLKSYGRPLYMSEYGVFKLVHLVSKMADAFVLVGKGPRKLICLRNPDRHVKKFENTPVILKRGNNGKCAIGEITDVRTEPNVGSSSDDSGDEERNGDPACELDDHLEGFRQEMQELLVCYSCPVPVHNFESLYKQRYKKAIDYQSFGAEGLEELVEKVRDVVDLCEDRASKLKFLVSNLL